MRRFQLLLAFASCGASAAPALAATAFFDVSVAGDVAGLAAGPYGTVKVEESAGSLIFTETLNSGFRIHDGNGNHNAFSFNLSGSPAITISNLTAGFARVTGSVTAPPLGSFAYAIDCTTCGPGYNGGNAGPLSFTVTANSGSLSLASLTTNLYNGYQVYFSTDLVDRNGTTGNIGAIATAAVVPEPATWAMIVCGFGLLGTTMRRSNRTMIRSA